MCEDTLCIVSCNYRVATYGVGGGAVATLKSIGAAGLGVGGTLVSGIAGAFGGKIVKDKISSESKQKHKRQITEC